MAVAHLSDEQLAELGEGFGIIDSGCKGHLNAADLKRLLRSMGLSKYHRPDEAALNASIAEIDSDGTGEADLPEVIAYLAKHIATDQRDYGAYLAQVFRKLDADNDGFITTCDVAQICASLGEEMPQEELDAMVQEG
eukprot:TRINITY_DN2684_c0_g1_i1.p2 TRINITY_DN2684_c0_g1~~TRINITY_DN2684_c0_g1_i1.p2  ORF type:complete len:137 (-),score=49.41 TRINITY_DN2684_c0_g1_i1:72-482(-)